MYTECLETTFTRNLILRQLLFCYAVPPQHMLLLGPPHVHKTMGSSWETGPRFCQWMHCQTTGSSFLSSPDPLHCVFHISFSPRVTSRYLTSFVRVLFILWYSSLTTSFVFLLLVKSATSFFSGFVDNLFDLHQVSIFLRPPCISFPSVFRCLLATTIARSCAY